MTIWTRTIRADGAEATPEQQEAAWAEFLRRPAFIRTAPALASILEGVGVTGTARLWPTARVADRMLQKARRAGIVKFNRKFWEVQP